MDTAIDAAHIGRRFGDIVALDDVSFSITRGAVFGLLGPNGAGKTTAVRILNGVIAPTKAGHIHILGRDLARDAQSIRQKVGVLTDTNLYERLTALDNLQLFGMLYDMTRDEARARSEELLAQFDLVERSHDRVETFSKGMKQKLSIARALIADPELIYLDEPTVGSTRRPPTSFCSTSRRSAATAQRPSLSPRTGSRRWSRSAPTSASWRAGASGHPARRGSSRIR